MTLIAFRVQPDHAEIVTDSLVYGPKGLSFSFASKVNLLSHLDAAVMGRGPTSLGIRWKARLFTRSPDDFDGLDSLAKKELPGLWDNVQESLRRDGHNAKKSGTIFHVGYSLSRRRFAALGYIVDDDGVESVDLTEHELFAVPCPFSPISGVPATVEDWVTLAKTIHDDYALEGLLSGSHQPIAGDAIHTRLELGRAETRRIHRFPTEGATFRKMLIGTYHRHGQLGPCLCGSGQPFAVCHLAYVAEWPCECGSGKRLRDCHLIDPLTPESRQYFRDHVSDYHDTQQELADAWAREVPDARHVSPVLEVVPPKLDKDAAVAAIAKAAQPSNGKVGRNEPCPCGSGAKFKKCCQRVGASV